MRNRRRFIIIVGICLLGLALAPPAQAVYFNYADFADVSDFLLIAQARGIYDNVNYSPPGRHVLRLTRTEGPTLGVAWLLDPITLASDYSFATTFLFRMITHGADGFTFVVQTAGVDETMWGGGGGNLGYKYDSSTGQTRISPSVAVEFDTHDNTEGDDRIYCNHVAIDQNGYLHEYGAFEIPPIDLNDGTIWQAWIQYDSSTLHVWVGPPGSRPATPVLSSDLNLAGLLGTNQVYLGFTASWAGSWQHHDILSWQFSSVPAPSTILLLGTGLLGLLGLGRRQKMR